MDPRPQHFGRSSDVFTESDLEKGALGNNSKPQLTSSTGMWFPIAIYTVCFLSLLVVIWSLLFNFVIVPYMISGFLRESQWSITQIAISNHASHSRADLNSLGFQPSFTFEVTNVKHAFQVYVGAPMVYVTNSTGPPWPLGDFTSKLKPAPYSNTLTAQYEQGATAWNIDWLPNTTHYEITLKGLIDVTIFGITRKDCSFTKTFEVNESVLRMDLLPVYL